MHHAFMHECLMTAWFRPRALYRRWVSRRRHAAAPAPPPPLEAWALLAAVLLRAGHAAPALTHAAAAAEALTQASAATDEEKEKEEEEEGGDGAGGLHWLQAVEARADVLAWCRCVAGDALLLQPQPRVKAGQPAGGSSSSCDTVDDPAAALMCYRGAVALCPQSIVYKERCRYPARVSGLGNT